MLRFAVTLLCIAPLATALAAPKFKVAVIGGGPAGSCAADSLTGNPNIECVLFERKLDNAKPCGGAIPLCMIDEFQIPDKIIDRKVRKMKLISPSNREVDIGQTLKPGEFIGMVRREILDGFLRDRAIAKGAQAINALVTEIKVPKKGASANEKYVIEYNEGPEKKSMEVDYIIGADGANSRLAKAIDAGEYNYAIAFQERIKIPADKMEFYEELAEMYVGDDVSPDFYAWVFPKYDHVAVGTGTLCNRPEIKKYQNGIRERAKAKIEGGKIIKIEAHPIPDSYRPRRVVDRAALVGDAAGYVTKCSGEGIYFAAKSGRMAGAVVNQWVAKTGRLPNQNEMINDYIKPYDKLYGPTYTVLDILQNIFFSNNAAREAFVELCGSEYVQKVTFDSYLFKKVQGTNPFQDIKLLFDTIGSLFRGQAFAAPDAPYSNPVESLKRL